MSTLRELKARATELVEAIEKDDDELTKRIDKEVRAWLVGVGDQPDFEDLTRQCQKMLTRRVELIHLSQEILRLKDERAADIEDCGQWDDIQAAHDEISDADYDTDFYRDEA